MSHVSFKLKRRGQLRPQIKGWTPDDVESYCKILDEQLEDLKTQLKIQDSMDKATALYRKLEKLIVDTARSCSRVDERIAYSKQLSEDTMTLIQKRQQLTGQELRDKDLRRDLAKQIQRQ
eukprot:4713490-Karenia_brevis.AAC.1